MDPVLRCHCCVAVFSKSEYDRGRHRWNSSAGGWCSGAVISAIAQTCFRRLDDSDVSDWLVGFACHPFFDLLECFRPGRLYTATNGARSSAFAKAFRRKLLGAKDSANQFAALSETVLINSLKQVRLCLLRLFAKIRGEKSCSVHFTGVASVPEKEPSDNFSRIAESEGNTSIFREFLEFLMTNKKWWLGPIVLVLLALGGLLLLTSTAAAPFIYTLF